MSTITVQEIQHDPNGFLRRVEAGEVMVLVQGERAIAEVHPLAIPTAKPRPFGLCAGQFVVPLDFDEPLPNAVLADFEGQ